MILQSLHWLTGKTLTTLARKKEFEVLQVTDHGINIIVYSTSRKRHITGREIELAWNTLVKEESITASDILNDIPSRNSTYIVAIFAEIDGVSCLTFPIRLFYKNS